MIDRWKKNCLLKSYQKLVFLYVKNSLSMWVWVFYIENEKNYSLYTLFPFLNTRLNCKYHRNCRFLSGCKMPHTMISSPYLLKVGTHLRPGNTEAEQGCLRLGSVNHAPIRGIDLLHCADQSIGCQYIKARQQLRLVSIDILNIPKTLTINFFTQNVT